MRGFTLVELLIVIAIIAILLGIAIPQYNQYTSRAKFLAAILAATPYKIAAEVAIQTDGVSVDALNAGAHGIPEAVTNSSERYVDSVDMRGGVISVTSKDILPADEDQPEYQVGVTIEDGRIRWTVQDNSSCLAHKLCTK